MTILCFFIILLVSNSKVKFSSVLNNVNMWVPNPNEPMTINPKDGGSIKGMMKDVKYVKVMDMLLQSKFPK